MPTKEEIEELFDRIDRVLGEMASSTWDALNESGPALADSVSSAYARLTQNGTLSLSLPDFDALWANSASALDSLAGQAGLTSAPPPPPPPPPEPTGVLVSVKRTVWSVAGSARRHPWITLIGCFSATTAASYFFCPALFSQLTKPARPYLPTKLLPPALARRPLKTGDHRREAVLVLGADTPLGREVALELSRKGFVVIATVRQPSSIDSLERTAGGFLKALVLDPSDSSPRGGGVPAFLRSCATALALRFPLHAPGDPFARPSGNELLRLSALVNCLPLAPLTTDGVVPVEALAREDIAAAVEERVGAFVAVTKGVLGDLRAAAARPDAPEAVILTLFSAKTSGLALPFDGLDSLADSALRSALDSLRHELVLASDDGSQNMRVATLDVAADDSASSPKLASATGSIGASQRLDRIYGPALARRQALLADSPAAQDIGASQAAPTAGVSPRLARRVSSRVFDIVVYSRGGAHSRLGARARAYALAGSVPAFISDTFLRMHEQLLKVAAAASNAAAATRANQSSERLGAQPASSTGRPLPVPPPLQRGAGPSQTHTPATTSSYEQVASRQYQQTRQRGEDTDSENEHTNSAHQRSSLEDSFVGSEAGWEGPSVDNGSRM